MGLFGPPDIGYLRGRRDVKGLIRALSYKQDNITRRNAALALGEIADAAATGPLIAALRDMEPDVRHEAAMALAKIGWKPDGGEAEVYYHIARWEWDLCAKMGARAVEPLIAAFKGKDDPVREGAAKALGNIDDARTVEILIEGLKDRNILVRKAAAVSLGKVGGARAVEALIGALQGNASTLREEAADALGETGDSRAIQPLITVLKDRDWDITLCLKSVKALGRIGGKAIEALVGALQGHDTLLRQKAADALGEIGGVSAIRPLISVLKDQDVDMRQRAAWALGKMGTAAVQPLTGLLTDENKHVRGGAAYALELIGDDEAVGPLIGALGDEDKDVRLRAAWALGKITDIKAMEPLIGAFRDEDEEVRRAVAYALGKMGDRAVEPLIARLQDEEGGVRWGAALALGKMGDSRAVEALGVALQDESATVRDEIARALSRIGGARAMELLGWAGGISLKSLESPVFQWSGSFVGSNPTFGEKVRKENASAMAWFNAQNFLPIPTSAGEKGAADYCFAMAAQAQKTGNVQEAWAGYHQALHRFCRLDDEKMIGLTCFNLGKVYGVRENWEMAQLMFLQSAYLTHKVWDEKGYIWSVFYLGDTCERLGNKALAKQFLLEVLPIFRYVSSEDVPGIEKALRRLSEG